MSLRVRLVLLIVALVAVVAVALSALYLDNLANSRSADALERSELAAQQVNTFVTDHINQHSHDFDPPSSLEETRELWNEIVSNDPDISPLLLKMVARSAALVEINIGGQTGLILASSDPSKIGQPLVELETISKWRSRPLYRRLIELFSRRSDYQVEEQIGFGQLPVFNIQVVASGVLLRGELLPELRTLAAVSGLAILAAMTLTVLITNRVLRPLKRIELTIDRIVQGNYRGYESSGRLSKEFAAVESKLNLLGQQFSGAREEATELQHNLDELIERMASQLDVASRLAAISRVTSGVAHEIKNPLNAISLRLDLLRAQLGAPEEELTAEIDILSNEVMRLDRVVKTFLDFSRPVEVSFRDVDLAALAAEVARLMTPQAALAGIAIEFAVPADAGGPDSQWIVRGDADMLKQAILNLVTNALEAMKNGGNLRLAVSRSANGMTLEVSDNGPGIPRNLRDKVFQLYFSTKVKGSGIGLAMTYRTVQLHNGTIEFSSDDGRGTTFQLQFPAVGGHA